MEKNEDEKELITLNVKDIFLQIDLIEESNQTLMSFAGQIKTLLSNPNIQRNQNAIGLLDDLLGAIYSMIFAKHLEFIDRTDKPIEDEVIKKRASQVQTGAIRIDGKWSAGWHFNSALYRIASVYHRLLKLIENGSDKRVGDLVKAYKDRTGEDWENTNTHKIHLQVNKLKHKSSGVYFSRSATFDEALKSIEELLSLFRKQSELIN